MDETQKAVDAVIGALDARKAAEKAEAEKVASIKAEARKEVEAEFAAKAPAWKGGFATKKLVGKQDPKSERNDALMHWIRTGDILAAKAEGYAQTDDSTLFGGAEYAAKAAMQEDNSSEGGFLVPVDFFDQIIARRNEKSFVRAAGARVVQTSRDSIQFPTEGTATTTFVFTAEEANSNQNEPVLDPITVQVYKLTKHILVSNELLADQAANLEQFIGLDLADKMAMTENRYVMRGTGSSQHLGIFTTDATYDPNIALLSTDNIAGAGSAASIIAGAYTLAAEYRGEASWFMHNTTEGQVRSLVASTFVQFPSGNNASGTGFKIASLLDRPVYNQQNIELVSDIADSDDVLTYPLAFGDLSYYALVERSGLEVSRNPWLYQLSDQTAIFAKFRQGGAPLRSEAFTLWRGVIQS